MFVYIHCQIFFFYEEVSLFWFLVLLTVMMNIVPDKSLSVFNFQYIIQL